MTQQLGLWDFTRARDHRSMGIVVRPSARARHLILQVVPPSTVEVVVPIGTRPREVEAFVAANRAWISRAKAELQARSRGAALPKSIELRAVGLSVQVTYRSAKADRVGLTRAGDELVVRSSREDFHTVAPLLGRWLVAKAKLHLKPWIHAEAKRLSLLPRGVQIRLQRTRWGSCSSRGNVSLNASLLLVRPEAVRYLFVHELCHLRWLSHSRRYWTLVESIEPNYRSLDRELNEAWAELPAWVQGAMRPELRA